MKQTICKLLGVDPDLNSKFWSWEIEQVKAKLIRKFPGLHMVYFRIASKVRPVKKRMDQWMKYAYPYWKIKMLHPGISFLVLTPEHENIGDHAIAKAETDYLIQLGIRFHEVTGKELEVLRENDLLNIFNGNRILANGGGYLGTLWFDSELILRELVLENPKSPIVLFPNTMYYEQSPWGQKELEKSVEIYNGHQNITMFAREETSYKLMKQCYKNVWLVPDIVLTSQYESSTQNRVGCALCLRNDCEKTMTEEKTDRLKNILNVHFGDQVFITDMVSQFNILRSQRAEAVDLKIHQFQGTELVITDRLHGMVFCAISGTPCIVLGSKSHKVRGTYSWIQDLPYIRFVDSIEEVDAWIPEMRTMKNCHYDRSERMPKYEKLMEVLLRK